MPPNSLAPLFRPQSIAVIGESVGKGSAVWTIVERILASGFSGRIVPVVPDTPGAEIQGLQVLQDIDQLPCGIDLAVMCQPFADMEERLVSLAQKGVRFLVCLEANTPDSGMNVRGAGDVHEQHLCDQARKLGITLVGPRSLGLINTVWGVNATLCLPPVSPGNIAFFSQSASLTQCLLDMAQNEMGFSQCISLGRCSSLCESDLLAFWEDDPSTKIIAGYLESVADGPRFLRTAQNVTRKKSVIVIRPGTTPPDTSAVHQPFPDSAATYATVFKQTGIINAPDIPSFFSLLKIFSSQPLPQGNNLAIVTNSASLGVLAADAAASRGFDVPCCCPDTSGQDGWHNPVVMKQEHGLDVWQKIFDRLRENSSVHIVVVAMVQPHGMGVEAMENMAHTLAESLAAMDKTVCFCLPGGEMAASARHIFESRSLPCFTQLHQAMYALGSMRDYVLWQKRPYPVEVCYRRDAPRIKKILEDARDAGISLLQGVDAHPLLLAYELALWEIKPAPTAKSAAKMSRKMGFPVILTPALPQGEQERLGRLQCIEVEDNNGVYQAFEELTQEVHRVCPELSFSGCLVQKKASPLARRVCIRLVRHHQFGPILSFSLDSGDTGCQGTAHRLVPLSLQDAQGIIREPWAFPILYGKRGEPEAHLGSLEDVLLTISQLAMDCPEIIELELDPVYVDDTQTVIGDARIVLNF